MWWKDIILNQVQHEILFPSMDTAQDVYSTITWIKSYKWWITFITKYKQCNEKCECKHTLKATLISQCLWYTYKN